MVDENQTAEMFENLLAVLREARELAEMMAREDLRKRLDTAWFELHQHLDPHCSCNDCLAEMEGPDDEVCPNWEPAIFCECDYCAAQRAELSDDGLPTPDQIRAAGISDDEGERPFTVGDTVKTIAAGTGSYVIEAFTDNGRIARLRSLAYPDWPTQDVPASILRQS